MRMVAQRDDPTTRLRLVETWLPLAQELNQRYGWNDDGSSLEQLIVDSMAALALCTSVDEAHLVLFIARRGLRQQSAW